MHILYAHERVITCRAVILWPIRGRKPARPLSFLRANTEQKVALVHFLVGDFKKKKKFFTRAQRPEKYETVREKESGKTYFAV